MSNLQSEKVFESPSFLKVFQVNGVMGVYVMSLKKIILIVNMGEHM